MLVRRYHACKAKTLIGDFEDMLADLYIASRRCRAVRFVSGLSFLRGGDATSPSLPTFHPPRPSILHTIMHQPIGGRPNAPPSLHPSLSPSNKPMPPTQAQARTLEEGHKINVHEGASLADVFFVFVLFSPTVWSGARPFVPLCLQALVQGAHSSPIFSKCC